MQSALNPNAGPGDPAYNSPVGGVPPPGRDFEVVYMKTPWFKRIGWFYLPVSWQGITLTVIAVFFCAQVFVAIDRHSNSATDTLFRIFPYFACAFLLLNWAGMNSSRDH